MAHGGSVAQSIRMTTPPVVRTVTTYDCCRRPMSSIEVTTRGVTLVVHSCRSCGRHIWEKDGQAADRAELLDGVKTYLEQPRIPTPRRSAKRPG